MKSLWISHGHVYSDVSGTPLSKTNERSRILCESEAGTALTIFGRKVEFRQDYVKQAKRSTVIKAVSPWQTVLIRISQERFQALNTECQPLKTIQTIHYTIMARDDTRKVATFSGWKRLPSFGAVRTLVCKQRGKTETDIRTYIHDIKQYQNGHYDMRNWGLEHAPERCLANEGTLQEPVTLILFLSYKAKGIILFFLQLNSKSAQFILTTEIWKTSFIPARVSSLPLCQRTVQRTVIMLNRYVLSLYIGSKYMDVRLEKLN